MITLKSDFSPKLASKEQHEDNELMLKMLLVLAGLSVSDVELYSDGNEKILIDAGITIKNVLTKNDTPGYFSHITTTVYNDYKKSVEIARIERPVLDAWADRYNDNQTGFSAANE